MEKPGLVDADLALKALVLLQQLLDTVVGERSREMKAARSAVTRRYTPRSEVPLSRLATAPAMSPRIGRRSLQFSCPCCSRSILVVARQAGARLRCPHCDAAVVAPHPRRRRSAHSQERDIEALLHPDHFAAALRPMPPPWMRLVAREPVLILALAALVPFTALLMLELPGVIDRARGGVPSNLMTRLAPEPPRHSPADGASERAVALVEKYLAAATVESKAAVVRDPQRVAPLMQALASRHPESMVSTVAAQVKAAGLTHYQDPANPVPVTPVVAQMPDGSSRTFLVEHSSAGDCIEWESSIGYSEPLESPRRTRGKTLSSQTQAVWRVEAVPDDYFNRAFADEQNLICLKLARADRPQEMYWAYAAKDSEAGFALRQVWNQAPHDFAQRLTVTVEAGPASAKTRQVRLAAVHHAGWRTPDQKPALVAGHP
jgi:hypothetical protein